MYYYFASTLPMIDFDGSLPLAVEDFAVDCDRLLSEKDAADARIASGLEEGEPSSVFLRQWQQFDRALKNEIALIRVSAKQQNSLNGIYGEREFDSEIALVISQIAKMENLLEAEKKLMRLQWQRLDELTLNKDFSLEFILAYAMRLKILGRLNAFKTDEGSKELENIMESAAQSEEG